MKPDNNERCLMESKIVYFEDGGAKNTEATFKLVQERLRTKEIKKIVGSVPEML
jgi:hypothetical protein